MAIEAVVPAITDTQRYDSVLRISEALVECCRTEELAKTLATELARFLHFDHLYVVVLKENSREIESLVWGKGALPLGELRNLPIDSPRSEALERDEPLHVPDWRNEQRFPVFKEWAARKGFKLGSEIGIPLTTPHRRLGAFGISSDTVTCYSEEDITFLQVIARVVAFAIDDGLNLRRAQEAQMELQQKNERLRLLLDLTKRITSNLELRELLRAIAANIREVMQCDAVGVSLLDPATGKSRIYALDFPQGKGFIQEEETITNSGAGQRVLETLEAEIISHPDPSELPSEMYDKVAAEGIRNTCLIPLVNRARALGLLAVARTTDEPFTPDDLEFLTQAGGQVAVAVENALAFNEISELRDKLAQEKIYLEEEIRTELNFEQIVGNSPAVKHVLELVDTVAPSDSTVLLLGETGTGKELVARAIHDHSRRQHRTFVKMNCAAIPTGLLESELFGHEKGAFTGAISQKVGRLELADQGTLFLDEVGDIPLEIQPKLLRALQEREFERLGSTHTRKVNTRLVAATNRDLEKMIVDKEFRSDLYYRLNVFPIRIPPLRERKEDIPLLVSYFVQKSSKQMQKKIDSVPAAVMKGLTSWEWPGNIRELENFIERAVILTQGRSLQAPMTELRRLHEEEQTQPRKDNSAQDISRIVKETINALNGGRHFADERAKKQREEIVQALTETRGRVGGADGAAARMRINRTTLLSRMKKFGINPRQYV